MSSSNTERNVVIIGAGPVGLYLAGILAQQNFTVTILEKKTEVDRHSKSLGIHPVSLELFDDAGIADRFTETGLQIQKGHAFIDQKKIGAVSFETCPKPFDYILALPQYRTEEILESWCRSFDNIIIQRGADFTSFSQIENGVDVSFTLNDERETVRGSYLVGCDGKNSKVRKLAGIHFEGSPYPDTYIMGDYSDNTDFGPDAAVYLHRDGLIESFPLPDSRRRWVVKTDSYIEQPDRTILDTLVEERLNHSIDDQTNSMISSFGVQHHLAETFHKDRILLAGDSAHVVSPIGGQGMNLGWITAANLAQSLSEIRKNENRAKPILDSYSRVSQSTAKTVAKRAEINMWLGRKRSFPLIRNLIARLIVNTPLQRKMAQMFTMRNL
ncbi:FAD-dependent oxidoreductase [Rhodohalobacter sp. 8-1]|uniref:FAD-dependent oxidoreductase n=1 Tax=Rhodohalobacter sp. 8-1 TaxID=3131972 RepID=UPI0030EC3DFC